MGNDQRRLQKRKERERRVRSQREEKSAKRQASFNTKLMRDFYKLPEIPIEAFGVPDEAVALISGAMDTLKVRFPNIIEETWLIYLRDYRRGGWEAALDAAAKDISTDPNWAGKGRREAEAALKHFIEIALGEALVKCMPSNLIRHIVPFTGFSFVLRDGVWTLKVRSLEHGQTTHGGVYYSPHQPTVGLDFGRKFVGFSRHAVLQMCDRIVPNWYRTYVGISHVFGFLYECVYFEPVWLPNRQPGFSVWNSCCRIGREFWDKVKTLANTSEDSRDRYYYRVGYCPVAIDGNAAIAKTFLAPGYQSTPEKDLFRQRFQNPQKVAPFELAADDGINVIKAIEDPKTWAAIEWFHKKGVPQVMRLDLEVFRNDSFCDLRDRTPLAARELASEEPPRVEAC
jgi:hypothetical protein